MSKNVKNKSRKNLREVGDVGPLVKFGATIALCVLLIPVFIVVLTGLNAGDHLTFPPEGLSTRWIVAFFKSEVFLSAFLFSFGLALITMVISTILGTDINVLGITTVPGNIDGYNAYKSAEIIFNKKALLKFRTRQGLLHNDSGRYIALDKLNKEEKIKLKRTFKTVKEIQSLIEVRFQVKNLLR